MFIKIIIENIKTNPQIHQVEKLLIMNEIPAITVDPNIKNNNPVFIVSFINKAGVIFEKPYFLFNLKVEYNSKGKVKIQFITINKSRKSSFSHILFN
jgi:hypothetical protein